MAYWLAQIVELRLGAGTDHERGVALRLGRRLENAVVAVSLQLLLHFIGIQFVRPAELLQKTNRVLNQLLAVERKLTIGWGWGDLLVEWVQTFGGRSFCDFGRSLAGIILF